VTHADTEGTRGHSEFVSALADRMGLGSAVHEPGTSVVAADDRSGSAMVVAYSISAHTVLWCDPAIAGALAEVADASITKPLDEIGAWGERSGWKHISSAYMQLLRSSGIMRPQADASIVIRPLDRHNAQHIAMIDTFKAVLSDDDRDEADLDRSELDDHILAVVDEQGIAAFASQRPFVYADQFADIAIATRPDTRGRGLGRIAVTALCDEIGSTDLVPLYRCDTRNQGSVRLSASLGFVPVITVLALGYHSTTRDDEGSG
jgi:GNAT superfamily N-acetyltransferase